ncbi:hypothetical protein CC86DRAFT_411597 [Ophiobolus disseminans]|uniref:Uncharacterized protein n=1 Tax=Ophiobolus disseminans TaxID=1469910 RepID=A0A6A6ZIH1_9PLEO|nr:hypothetical protein CC86DRAFT_411597 [Ophiobolus disseminans]
MPPLRRSNRASNKRSETATQQPVVKSSRPIRGARMSAPLRPYQLEDSDHQERTIRYSEEEEESNDEGITEDVYNNCRTIASQQPSSEDYMATRVVRTSALPHERSPTPLPPVQPSFVHGANFSIWTASDILPQGERRHYTPREQLADAKTTRGTSRSTTRRTAYIDITGERPVQMHGPAPSS